MKLYYQFSCKTFFPIIYSVGENKPYVNRSERTKNTIYDFRKIRKVIKFEVYMRNTSYKI
jgi:hypothetical protein